MMASAAAPPPLTVGDVNAKLLAPRAVMWVVAVYLPSMYMATAAAVAYCFYPSKSFFPVPCWLPPLMLWGVYMAVLSDAVMYMHLFLPRAPFAVRQSLFDIGMYWVGIPLACLVALVASLGQPWMAVALSCVMVVLISGVVAFWVWLARKHRSTS
ncbi:hypothetical protein EJB05_40703, partial [Eragrostis curvula]